MGKFLDLTNHQYERLTVIKLGPKTKSGMTQWYCQCSCGNPDLTLVTIGNLRRGNTKSCGCLDREVLIARSTKHGCKTKEYKHPLYETCSKIKDRCYNPNIKIYKYYGGKGITMCDHWKDSFTNFLEDMGERPPCTTLDRIDGTKGYYKENCRWATKEEQANNKSNVRLFDYEGEKLSLTEIARRSGLSYMMLYQRIYKYSLSLEEALVIPARKRFNKK